MTLARLDDSLNQTHRDEVTVAAQELVLTAHLSVEIHHPPKLRLYFFF